MSIALRNCSAVPFDVGDTHRLGASLAGNQILTSKNGTFALGIFSPRGTNNGYVGIWYAPFSQKAIVWVANRENPVRNMPGILKFSRDGHLRLFDRKGRSVWSTDIGLKGSRAVLRDSGNFICLGEFRASDRYMVAWHEDVERHEAYFLEEFCGSCTWALLFRDGHVSRRDADDDVL
ncbi:hypothetical protein SUGI_1089510 [Cryptomeria japonica]|nr:hypothetical protein SUGI_1089510 [Cryptomeria japonica]